MATVRSTSVDKDVQVNEGTNTDKQTKKVTLKIPKELQVSLISKEDAHPQIYQLQIHKTYRSPSDSVVRYVVGSSSVLLDPLTMASERVLMLVGATGTGKTTLVNGIANYIYGTKWKDDYRLKVIDKEGSHSQAFSQTKEINAYTFPMQEGSLLPYTLTVIDTPGFGDSAGPERDQSIVKQIHSFFSLDPPDGIKFLHGIGFVVKATDSRLTPAQSYIFNSILRIFGKDIENNIFVIITFSDTKEPLILDALEEAKIPCQEQGFKFNNSALFAERYVCGNDEDDDEDTINSLKFGKGMKSFKHFFDFFEKAEQRSLQQTQEVLEEREQLELQIEGLRKQIVTGMGKLSELQQEEKIFNQHKTDIEANKDFTYTVEATEYEEVPTKKGVYATHCTRCNFTCHYPCKCNKDKHNCRMMKNERCTVCRRRCHHSKHTSVKFYYEIVIKKVNRTYEDTKARYDDATSKLSDSERVLHGLENELSQVKAGVLTLVREAHDTVNHLKEIALRPDPLSETDYIKQCIDNEKREGKPGWEERTLHFEEMLTRDKYVAKVMDFPYENIQDTSENEDTETKRTFEFSESFRKVMTLPYKYGPDQKGQKGPKESRF